MGRSAGLDVCICRKSNQNYSLYSMTALCGVHECIVDMRIYNKRKFTVANKIRFRKTYRVSELKRCNDCNFQNYVRHSGSKGRHGVVVHAK